MANSKNLFSSFKAQHKNTWIKQVEKDLKGKPIESLYWPIDKELIISPFFHPDDQNELEKPILNGQKTNDWAIGEDIIISNIKKAREQTLTALSFGINSPRFILKKNPDLEMMSKLLESVQLDIIEFHFIQKNRNNDAAELLKIIKKLAKKRGYKAESLKGSIEEEFDLNNSISTYASIIKYARKYLPQFNVIVIKEEQTIEDLTYADGLANLIFKGNQALEKIQAKRLDITTINQHLKFSISIGENYFVEIARIRALKLLWANVLRAWKVTKSVPITIDAYIDERFFEENENANMIRSTTLAMSAVLAGVDRLTIRPSDGDYDNEFSKRIARNIQHLLKMESHFDDVIDPAAGSYFLEQLTNTLANEAWEKFKIMM